METGRRLLSALHTSFTVMTKQEVTSRRETSSVRLTVQPRLSRQRILPVLMMSYGQVTPSFLWLSSVCVDGSDVSLSGAQLCCGKRRAEKNKPPGQNTEVFKRSSVSAHFREARQHARLHDGTVRDSFSVSGATSSVRVTVSESNTHLHLSPRGGVGGALTWSVGRGGCSSVSVRSGLTARRWTAARSGGGAEPIG